MKKIYGDACDKYVAAVVVYANSSNKIFYDAELKTAVPNEDGLNLFIKGVVCKKGTTYYRPVSCTEAGVINFGITSGT